jgi:hypothetical protein
MTHRIRRNSCLLHATSSYYDSTLPWIIQDSTQLSTRFTHLSVCGSVLSDSVSRDVGHTSAGEGGAATQTAAQCCAVGCWLHAALCSEPRRRHLARRYRAAAEVGRRRGCFLRRSHDNSVIGRCTSAAWFLWGR